jgi:uncharacterized protein YndB with AHSA1/START domain
MNTEPLIFERVLDAPVDRVWSALTNVAEMKKWYFDVPDFKPEVGTEFSFTAGPEGGFQYVHLCKVTKAEPNKVIAYTWRYDGYEGNSEVTFELFAEGDKTRLKLTHTGLETFPAIPEFAKANFVEGWTYFTTKALPEYLTK